MTESPLQAPGCSRKVVIYCSSVSAVHGHPPALIQGVRDVPGPSGSFPPAAPGRERGHRPSCPVRALARLSPALVDTQDWDCRVREDRLGKASGLWPSEGAEVEAIANVAESAHSDVAAQ